MGNNWEILELAKVFTPHRVKYQTPIYYNKGLCDII